MKNSSPLLEFYRRLYYDNSRISCYNGRKNKEPLYQQYKEEDHATFNESA